MVLLDAAVELHDLLRSLKIKDVLEYISALHNIIILEDVVMTQPVKSCLIVVQGRRNTQFCNREIQYDLFRARGEGGGWPGDDDVLDFIMTPRFLGSSNIFLGVTRTFG